MSKITLKHNKKDYTLEYNRQSVKTMESQGFILDEISTKPATMLPHLFAGAFIKNHKGTKRKDIDEIYDNLREKTELISVLVEMYAETLSELVDDAANSEGNVTWAVVK